MPNWKKVAVSGSAASFSSLTVDTSVTASIFSGSQFIGNLSGTASQAVSSSYALTASYALNGGSGGASGGATTGSNTFFGDQTISGSLVATGSVGASVILTSQTASSISIPTGYNGLLLTPVQMQGSSSIALGSRLIVL
jgi:hypothetical protein